MRSSKILILTSEFPPQPGGIGNHALNLARGLHLKGFYVQVLCDQRSVTGEDEKLFDSTLPFEVERISRKKFLILTYFARVYRAFPFVKETEVVISSGKFPLWLGAFFSLLLEKRYIAAVHGSEVMLTNKFLRKLTDTSLKRFDVVVAVSNFTKRLVSHLKLKQIVVVNNGIHPTVRFGQRKEYSPVPMLITIGNVTRRKGQHNVIKALPALLVQYPRLQYHIVGIPTEKEKLQKLALHLKVDKAVIFHGAVNEDEKQKLLQQADIFIMLSETTRTGDVEGFGIAILEANAVGIPSIGAKGCGIEDAIKDGFSGLLVHHEDEQAILCSMEEILRNYTTYSENAVKWAAEFSWDKVIPEYVALFQEG